MKSVTFLQRIKRSSLMDVCIELVNLQKIKMSLLMCLMGWGSLIIAKGMGNAGAIEVDQQLLTLLLWANVISTCVWGFIASIKSILIIILADLIAVALFCFGFPDAGLVALGISFLSLAIFYLGRIYYPD